MSETPVDERRAEGFRLQLPVVIQDAKTKLSLLNIHEHPAMAVFAKCYIARLEAIKCAADQGEGALLELEAAQPTILKELQELGRLCFFDYAGPDASDFVGDLMDEAGYRYSEVRGTLKEARSEGGAPRKLITIETLEMYLTGKSHKEILAKEPQQPDDDYARRNDRINKRISDLLPLYKQCRAEIDGSAFQEKK